jgi:hypothetical protein
MGVRLSLRYGIGSKMEAIATYEGIGTKVITAKKVAYLSPC